MKGLFVNSRVWAANILRNGASLIKTPVYRWGVLLFLRSLGITPGPIPGVTMVRGGQVSWLVRFGSTSAP